MGATSTMCEDKKRNLCNEELKRHGGGVAGQHEHRRPRSSPLIGGSTLLFRPSLVLRMNCKSELGRLSNRRRL